MLATQHTTLPAVLHDPGIESGLRKEKQVLREGSGQKQVRSIDVGRLNSPNTIARVFVLTSEGSA